MIKKAYFLLIAVLMSSAMHAQQTSLTVDCQNPGWLSYLIKYGDQLTLENLTVTGYINSDDLEFIGEMMHRRSLKGCINLENAHIVGKDASGDNVMPNNAFNIGWSESYPDGLTVKQIIFPLSLTGSTKCLSSYLIVDTLSIGGESMPSVKGENLYINEYSGGDGIRFNRNVKHLILREGVTEIPKNAFTNEPYSYHGASKEECRFESVTLPSTLTKIGEKAFYYCYALKHVVLPSNTDTIEANAFTNTSFLPDTLDLPLNLKTFRTSSFQFKAGQVIDVKENVEIFDNESGSIKESNNLTFIIHRTIPPVFKKDASNIYSIGKDLSGCTIYIPKESYSMYSDPTYDSLGGSVYHWSNWANPYSYAKVQSIYVNVEFIRLNMNELKLSVGNSFNLIATISPSNADNMNLSWITSNPNVANVDSNGNVTAIASGTATIKARSVDNPMIEAECKVIVHQPIQNITITPNDLTLNVNEQYENLELIIHPQSADNKSVIWSSDNPEICSVNNGVLTANSVGRTKIYAESVENKQIYATCNVTIIQPATGITLNYVNYTLDAIGESIQLTATVSPENATNKDVKWTSSNEAVCVVNNGLVVGVGEGTAVIVATTVDGGYMATCVITVKNKEYLLTYVVDGKVYHTESLPQGEKITLPEDPTKEGYTFSGWIDIPETMPEENITISGTFTINQYNVTYIIDGEVYTTIAVTYGENITLPEVPEREGYAFAWIDEVPETMPAEDIVINGSYVSTDISSVTLDDEIRRIYTIEGKKTNKFGQGINIVLMKDGSIRKVFVK